MDKEFNEWVARSIPASRPMTQGDMVYLKAAWLEATRRADRKAREECCEIIKSLKISGECAFESEKQYNRAIDDAVQAISDTIPE